VVRAGMPNCFMAVMQKGGRRAPTLGMNCSSRSDSEDRASQHVYRIALGPPYHFMIGVTTSRRVATRFSATPERLWRRKVVRHFSANTLTRVFLKIRHANAVSARHYGVVLVIESIFDSSTS